VEFVYVGRVQFKVSGKLSKEELIQLFQIGYP